MPLIFTFIWIFLIRFIVIIILFYFFYKVYSRDIPFLNKHKRAFAIFLSILILSFIFVNIVLRQIDIGTSNIIEKLSNYFSLMSAIAFGFVLSWLFLYLLSFIIKGLYYYFFKVNHSKKINIIVLIIAIIVNIYGVWNSFHIKVTKYTVTDNRLSDYWDGKSIVMFADTHIGRIITENTMNQVVDKVLEEKPEAVFIIGDLYDGPPVNQDKYIPILQRLSKDTKVFFVNGNHEKYGNTKDFYDSVTNSNIRVLNNESIDYQGLHITGFDYINTWSSPGNYFTTDKAVIEKNISQQNLPTIYMQHVPLNLDLLAADKNAVLSLHGHTHGGQMWPFTWIVDYIYGQYVYGNNKYNNMNVITTSGAGTWGPPQRIGTISEIVKIELKNK